MERLLSFFTPVVLWWMAGASLFIFLATIVVVPWMLVRMPADYFSSRRRPRPHWADRHPLLRLGWKALGTALGLLFVIAGFLLIFMPGQGLLTIVVGMTLMSYPGKYRLERWAITRPAVLASVNWLRRRAGREELELG